MPIVVTPSTQTTWISLY